MKKVIIAILLLIPILVILTIDASGLLIASAFVDIPAESIVIKHGGNELKSEEIILEEQNAAKRYTLFCEVFPGIATDEIEWESSNPDIAAVIPSESRKGSADMEFKDYGSVDVTCTSKKNTSISARVTFYITGRTPGYLLIADYSGNTLSEITLPLYASENLLASVKPAVSARGEKIQWCSDKADIVKVDQNGVITALSSGTAVITATVTVGEKTVSGLVTVTVSGTALLKQSVLYTAENSVNVATYLAETNATVEGGNSVNLSGMAEFESKPITVRYGSTVETFTIVKVQSLQTIVFENAYALQSGALSSFLSLGTSNVQLSAIALDGANPAVTWRTSDSGVVRVENGRLYAVGSGSAEITAEASGYRSESITVHVTNTVEDFRLSEVEYADKAGLLQERVFGNYTYQNGVYTRDYALSVRSFPEGASVESYTFESANTELATVSKTGVVTFASDVGEGKSVTITATAYNQEGLPVRRSYTFHLVNGVNVGVGVAKPHFDASKGERPENFDPYWDIQTVAHAAETKAIVLHTSVYYPSKKEGGTSIMNLTVPIYGNGNKLDGQFYMETVEDDEMLLMWDFTKFTNMPENLNVSLINLNLQATQPTTEDSKETFEELNKTGGGAIGMKGEYPNPKNRMNLIVKGCLFQYAYGHINFAIGDIVLDGCILRNNSASAIVLQQSSYGQSNLKIKNCIFSHTIAPVAIACGNFDEILARDNGESTGGTQFGNFELEGEIYVYNWKKLKEVQMSILPQNLKNKRANALVKGANSLLAEVIQQAFMRSSADNLYTDKEGEDWLNFSFLLLGLWADMNPHFNAAEASSDGVNIRFDPNYYNYAEVQADKAPTASGLMSFFSGIVDLKNNKTYHIMSRDGKGNWNTLPGENYEINDVTRARLAGERG